MNYTEQVSKWGIFEFSCDGKSEGNPFVDYNIQANFESAYEFKTVSGFYDGDGKYTVRFMPSFEGRYTFKVSGTFSDETYSGEFCVTAPQEYSHGPVRVTNTYNFSYADGTPFSCIGTTCYVWHLQSDELITQTLETLKQSPFNKIRFCVFPKHYDYNLGEPRSYPYVGTAMDSSVLTKDNFMNYNAHSDGNNWDFMRFNPEHFRHIEYCISQLARFGIEADLILMHPYDRWGFSAMTDEECELYLKYVTARFSSYANVWWSLANEYDLMQKSTDSWERYAKVIVDNDPYGHLRSIHNCFGFYDHTKPWITHCSIQRQDLYKGVEYTDEWRERYKKPIVLDEIAYEGNIQHGWGNITPEELTRRFWESSLRGGYPGHSETYMCNENVLWWSHGGILRGESVQRIAFLKKFLEQMSGCCLSPKASSWDDVCAEGHYHDCRKCRVYYYSFMRPSFREYHLDDDKEYAVKVIDTWNMTTDDLGTFSGKFSVPLASRQYMAVLITEIE